MDCSRPSLFVELGMRLWSVCFGGDDSDSYPCTALMLFSLSLSFMILGLLFFFGYLNKWLLPWLLCFGFGWLNKSLFNTRLGFRVCLLVGCVILLFFYFANKNPRRLGLGVNVWFVVVSSLCNQVHSDFCGGTWLRGCSSKTNFSKSFWDGSPRHNHFTFSSNPPRTCGVSVPCCWTEPGAHIKKLRSVGFFLAKSCSKGKKQTTWVFSMGNESPSFSACCWYFSDAYFLKTSKRFMKKELLRRAHKEDFDGTRPFQDEETGFKTVHHPRKFTITIYSLCLCLCLSLCWNLNGIVLAIVMLIMGL